MAPPESAPPSTAMSARHLTTPLASAPTLAFWAGTYPHYSTLAQLMATQVWATTPPPTTYKALGPTLDQSLEAVDVAEDRPVASRGPVQPYVSYTPPVTVYT